MRVLTRDGVPLPLDARIAGPYDPAIRSRILPLAMVLALCAAGGLLSGCGTETLSAEGVARAASATAAKGGASVSMRVAFTVPGSGRIAMEGSGVVDTAGKRGHMVFRAADPADLPGELTADALTQEVIFDDLTLYMRSQLFRAALPHGKRWIKIDLQQAGRAAGIDLSSLMGPSSQDPTQSLQLLKAVSGDVDEVGEEDVRGVATTHYKATVDLRRYASLAPAKDRAAARETTRMLRRFSGTRFPVEVWLDENDLVRRVRQSTTLKGPAGSTTIDQQVELYDYGTRVRVTRPPAREVQDFSALAGNGLKQLR